MFQRGENAASGIVIDDDIKIGQKLRHGQVQCRNIVLERQIAAYEGDRNRRARHMGGIIGSRARAAGGVVARQRNADSRRDKPVDTGKPAIRKNPCGRIGTKSGGDNI